MKLLLQALRQAVGDAAKARGLSEYRVLHKHNERGEMVVAVITSDPRLVADEYPRDRKPRRD